MARRRKRIKYKLNPQSRKSIVALGLFLLAGLIVFSYLGQGVVAESTLQQVFGRFFGYGVFLLPFLLVLLGLFLVKPDWSFAKLRVVIGFFLFTFCLMAFLHLFLPLEEAKNQALLGKGGGLIGYYVDKFLISVFSVFGSFLLILTLFVVSILVIFNASLSQVMSTVKSVTEKLSKIFQGLTLPMAKKLVNWRKEREEMEVEIVAHEEEEFEVKGPLREEKAGVIVGRTKLEEVPANEIAVVTEEDEISLPTKLASSEYQFPPLSLLSEPEEIAADRGDVKERAHIIETTLDSFGIRARVAEVNLGPAVTQYALDLAEGTKISKVTALQNDLAMALAAPTGTVRIEAPIPGKSLVGVEVPNYSPSLVCLKSILTSEVMQTAKSNLTIALGHNVAGEAVVDNISRWPHILIAGATGAGKSVLLHSFICTLLFKARPSEVKMILVDPKRVELTQYTGIPHLLTPVIVEAEKFISSLKWAIAEMDKRYDLFQSVRARNIDDYNRNSGLSLLPYILIFVDELADLMAFSPAEVEGLICRIAQMSRATGIHLLLATQRPSVDVITGLIKANIPARIAFNVASGTDSRVVIDMIGAEKLLGRGDMLFLPPDAAKPIRIQGVYVSDEEIRRLITFLKETETTPEYEEIVTTYRSMKGELPEFEVPEDTLFDEAVQVIINHDRASASLLQRRLRIGYARAARLLDELESRGIVSPKDGSKPREVYFTAAESYLQGKRQDQSV